MKCSLCLEELLWGGDHSYEDYGMEEDGIVSNYTCQNKECDVEGTLIYTKIT